MPGIEKSSAGEGGAVRPAMTAAAKIASHARSVDVRRLNASRPSRARIVATGTLHPKVRRLHRFAQPGRRRRTAAGNPLHNQNHSGPSPYCRRSSRRRYAGGWREGVGGRVAARPFLIAVSRARAASRWVGSWSAAARTAVAHSRRTRAVVGAAAFGRTDGDAATVVRIGLSLDQALAARGRAVSWRGWCAGARSRRRSGWAAAIGLALRAGGASPCPPTGSGTTARSSV